MSTAIEQEEISLRDIFLKIGGYFKELKSRGKLLVLVGIILGFIYAINAYLTSPSYHEQLTFMMDETKGDAVQGLDVLGSLFGSQKKDNLGKILQLFESKKIIHNTLFDSISINGKTDYLANHIFDLYTIPDLAKNYRYFGRFFWRISWPKQVMNNPDFRFNYADVDNFTPNENLYLRLLYERINGNGNVGIDPLLGSKLDEETGIMTLTMKSEYEDITLGVLNNIYKQLSGFFIEKSTEKQVKTFKIMKTKRDSVLNELKSKEYQLANFKDTNRKLVTVKGYLSQIRIERDVQILNLMYGEVVKQLEATDFALRNKTPVVQVIDLPRRPISPVMTSWKKAFIMGFFIGVLLLSFFIIVRKIFREIMEG